MEQPNEELLSGNLVPVLLGLTAETVQLAQRLFRRYNVISHVFCDRVPLPMRLSLCMKYHEVHRTRDEALMLRALEDFADQLAGSDALLYLVSGTENYTNLVWQHREQLERAYLIATAEELPAVWFEPAVGAEKGGHA